MKLAQYGSLAAAAALIQTAQFQTAQFQISQSQAPNATTDPLINRDANLAIYIGLAVLAVAIAFAIRGLNTKLEKALVFAFILSIVLVLILWYL